MGIDRCLRSSRRAAVARTVADTTATRVRVFKSLRLNYWKVINYVRDMRMDLAENEVSAVLPPRRDAASHAGSMAAGNPEPPTLISPATSDIMC